MKHYPNVIQFKGLYTGWGKKHLNQRINITSGIMISQKKLSHFSYIRGVVVAQSVERANPDQKITDLIPAPGVHSPLAGMLSVQ